MRWPCDAEASQVSAARGKTAEKSSNTSHLPAAVRSHAFDRDGALLQVVNETKHDAGVRAKRRLRARIPPLPIGGRVGMMEDAVPIGSSGIAVKRAG